MNVGSPTGSGTAWGGRFACALLASGWLWAAGGFALAAEAPGKADAPAPKEEVKAPETEAEVDARLRTVLEKLIALNNKVREGRDLALKQDQELRALMLAIDAKQKELENKLAEKYPEIAAMAAEQDQLMKEHRELSFKLQELRRKQAVEPAATK